MKRLVALIMVLALSIGLVGCSPKKKPLGDGDDVVINVNVQNKGYGTDWIYDAATAFKEWSKDNKYGENDEYTGAILNIIPNSATDNIVDFPTSRNHIVFGGGSVRNLNATNNDHVLKLSADTAAEKAAYGIDIREITYENYSSDGTNSHINSVYDLLKQDDMRTYLGSDGEIYALPTWEVFSGASYDKHLFDVNGLYFADTSKGSFPTIVLNENNCSLLKNEDASGNSITGYEELQFHLVNPSADISWESHKSVGPDGKTGVINGVDYSLDDGLPSSLLEFIALCDYMKTTCNIFPLQLCGSNSKDYSDNFLYGLVFSLMGKERAEVTRSFEGQMEVVVSFTGEEGPSNPGDPVRYLIPSLELIRVPKTEVITVTEETGFYTQWSVEKYYAMALIELFENQGWFAPGSSPTGNSVDNRGAQYNFVFSGYDDAGYTVTPVAFLGESSFWYNEAKSDLANFSRYYGERDVRWYSYPVNIANSVTGQDATDTTFGITESVMGEQNVIASSRNSTMTINRSAIEGERTTTPTAVKEAIEDFLKFWYSEDRLVKTTLMQGMGRNMNFTMPTSKLGEWAGFYKNLNLLKEQSYVLQFSSTAATFYNISDSHLKIGEGGKYMNCCDQYTHEILANETSKHSTAYSSFISMITGVDSKWTAEAWKGNYRGQYYDESRGNDKSYLDDYIKYTVEFRPPYDQWV